MRRTGTLLTLPALATLFCCAGMAASGGRCNISLPPVDNNNNSSGCTESTPSVLMTVTNGDGDVVPRARIGLRHNGGAKLTGGCSPDNPCEDFVLSLNFTGRFDVEVAAPGYVIANRTVLVGEGSDGCPDTENLIVVLQEDTTVAALAGAWRTTNLFGTTDLRFNDDGEIVGAIIYDAQAAGDGNFYIAYNNRSIRGAFGQQTFFTNADDPERTGDRFTWSTTTLGMPMGFEAAVMSDDFTTMQGTLANTTVLYTRLDEIPSALQDPAQ